MDVEITVPVDVGHRHAAGPPLFRTEARLLGNVFEAVPAQVSIQTVRPEVRREIQLG